jgi:hypothetical protein
MTEILDLIDGAIEDWGTSSDAMRWTPQPEQRAESKADSGRHRHGCIAAIAQRLAELQEAMHLGAYRQRFMLGIDQAADEVFAQSEPDIADYQRATQDALRELAAMARVPVHFFGPPRIPRQMHRQYRLRALARRRRNRR